MKDALQLLKDFCEVYFIRRDLEGSLALMTSNVHLCYMAKHIDVHTISGARHCMEREILNGPYPHHLLPLYTNVYCLTTGLGTGIAFAKITIFAKNQELTYRLSVSSRVEDDASRIATLSISEIMPDAEKPKLRVPLKRDGRFRLGSMMFCRLEDGFPITYVSQSLLRRLGYADEASFLQAVDGLAINCIHPEDREAVTKQVSTHLSMSSCYIGEYRIRRKDGAYIWVSEIWRKVAGVERGKIVLSCVIFGVSKGRDKRQTLESKS